MAQELAIILGFSVITLVFFELFTIFRNDRPILAILFFGLMMMMILVLVHALMAILTIDTTYIDSPIAIIYAVIMWSFILITVFITIMGFLNMTMTVVNYFCKQMGWRIPFTKPRFFKALTPGGDDGLM